MKKIKKFAFDVGWVFASSVIILLVHFLQKPIMARFLGPEGLGLYEMVITITGVIILIAGLGVNGAVVKYVAEYDNNRNRINSVFSSAIVTMAVLGTVSSIFLFLFSERIAGIFDMPSLSLLLKLYSFVFPFILIYEIIKGVFNGLREMKYFSYINILNGILIFLFIAAPLFLGFGINGAVVGTMVASIVVMVIAAYMARKLVGFKISDFRKSIKKLMSFGSQLMIGNAINVINYQADFILIAYFLTATDLGYYSVAVSLSRFFWKIPQSIQMVAYPATSEHWIKGEIDSLNKMIDKSMKYSACLLLPVGLGIWFFAEEVIGLLFGRSFIPSVLPFQILVLGTVIYGIGLPIGGTLAGIGRPDVAMKISAAAAILNIMLNIVLIPAYGVNGAAIATISSFILITISTIYLTVKFTNVNIGPGWYLSAFAVTLLAAALLTFQEWIDPYFFGFFILTIYISILYLFFLKREDKEIFKELIRSSISRR